MGDAYPSKKNINQPSKEGKRELLENTLPNRAPPKNPHVAKAGKTEELKGGGDLPRICHIIHGLRFSKAG